MKFKKLNPKKRYKIARAIIVHKFISEPMVLQLFKSKYKDAASSFRVRSGIPEKDFFLCMTKLIAHIFEHVLDGEFSSVINPEPALAYSNRQNMILYKYANYLIANNKDAIITDQNEFTRRMNDYAKALNVPIDDLKAFVLPMINETGEESLV